jgi:predicted RNase H-like HicB family nuclease
MKKAEQNNGDELRPEYKRTDFDEMVRGKYASRNPVQRLTLALECTEQPGGGWLAHIKEFPELSALADSWDNAVDRVEALAGTLIAARVERGEMPPTGLNFAITTNYSTSSGASVGEPR